MREIVFDTETTGFGVDEHRIIEIGCVEMDNQLPTGRTFHKYLNPQRDIDFGATKVHGITNEKVANAPLFADIVEEMLAFFGDAPLVAHNAEFDYGFMNMELQRCGKEPLKNQMVDTLLLARQKLPGQRHNLDALCRFYDIDLTARTYHGALLDAQLLADVYVELNGGLQANFGLEGGGQVAARPLVFEGFSGAAGKQDPSRSGQNGAIMASDDELARHREFLAKYVPNHKWGS